VLNLQQSPSNSPPVNVTFKANWPGFTAGPALDVQVVGTLAYLAIGGGGLLILDVSDPANPRKVGAFDTLGEARSVTVSGDYAYIADGPAGFEIIDVRNPGNPALTGWYRGLTNVNRIAVRSNYVYVADGSTGLRVFDVSNPSNPMETNAIPGTAGYVTVDGNYAYVCAGEGLLIIDISIPSNPLTVSTNADFYGQAVAVKGGFAFVLGHFLNILDVSNPINPAFVKSDGPPGSYFLKRVAVEGDFVYISNFGGPTLGIGNKVYQIDVSDVENPQYVRTFDGGESGVFVTNGLAYIVGSSGLHIYDVADPVTEPVSIYATESRPYNVTVQGNFAYMASGDAGVQIVDISNPASPALLGSVIHGTNAWHRPLFTVALAGAHAFADGLRIADVSNPRVPSLISDGSDGQGRVTLGLIASGDKIYDFSGQIFSQTIWKNRFLYPPPGFYLTVYSITNRESPQLLLIAGFGGFCRELSVSGNHGFWVSQDGLVTIDVNSLTLTTNSSLAVYSTSAVDTDKNFLALGGSSGLQVFDIANPTNPIPHGEFATSVSDLALYNGHAVCVDTTTGLRVIDVSNPSNFVQVASYPASGFEKVALAACRT
jgi:hypothetical protein